MTDCLVHILKLFYEERSRKKGLNWASLFYRWTSYFILEGVNFIFGPVNFILGPVNFIFGPGNFIVEPVNFLPHFPIENAKHSWIVWRDNAKWQKTFKVKIGARNYKRCLIISKKKPQKLFALSVPCLMTGALYHTVPPNSPCMLCDLD